MTRRETWSSKRQVRPRHRVRRRVRAAEPALRRNVDHAGDVVAVGVVDTYFDWLTFKVAPDGTRLWSRRYSTTDGDDEVPTFLAIDAANAIYVTGRAGPIPRAIGASLLMMTTITYEPSGAQAWVMNRDINRGVGVRVGTDQAVYDARTRRDAHRPVRADMMAP
jgi:hypothetical protein